jgi:hypothetical protein
MDTGGLGLKEGESSSAAIIAASEKQVGFAIDTAALILFVIDGLDRVTALDDRIAARLRRGGKPVILVVNKADFGDEKADLEGVARLGLGEPICVSAEHGRGESELREAILGRIGRLPDAHAGDAAAEAAGGKADGPICISFIGRPERGQVVAGKPAPQEQSPHRERARGDDPRRDRAALRLQGPRREAPPLPADRHRGHQGGDKAGVFGRIFRAPALARRHAAFGRRLPRPRRPRRGDAAGQGDRRRGRQGPQADRGRRQQMGPGA